jgi:beta-galactosidase
VRNVFCLRKDERGNVMPFFNRQAQIEVTGDIEIIGPALADINGGMGGVYVRSVGRQGKGSVKISLPDYGLEDVADFEVKA